MWRGIPLRSSAAGLMRLSHSVWETPFLTTDTASLKRLLKRIIPHTVSDDLRELVDLALAVITRAGVGNDQPLITPFTLLDGEVRYQLECDFEEGIVTKSEYRKLTRELNRLLAEATPHRRR
jgi:hypothetical protein